MNHRISGQELLESLYRSTYSASSADDLMRLASPGTIFGETSLHGVVLERVLPMGIGNYRATIVSITPEDPEAISARGVPVEWSGPGRYVEVLETPVAGGPARPFGRRLTDTSGRGLRGHTLLRAMEQHAQIHSGAQPMPIGGSALPVDALNTEDVRSELTQAIRSGAAGFQ